MSYRIQSDGYSEDGLSISEFLVEIEDDTATIRVPIDDYEPCDVAVVVKALEGEYESIFDLPLNPREAVLPGDALFTGEVAGPVTLSMQFKTTGFARIRVLVGKVRRGLKRFARSIPCRLCKLALSLIVNVILVSLGIPPTLPGTFDVTSYIDQLRQSFTDIASGSFGATLQFFHSLLPEGYPAIVWRILQGLNWVFEVTDNLFNDICEAFGLCPPRPLPG